MSQIRRPTLPSPSRWGIRRHVSGSGIATMSDSSIALNPVIEEPSKPMPSSSAPSSSDGVIAKLLRWPSMSVNQKRTYSTPSFFASSSTAFRAFGSDVARSLLSIIAIGSLLSGCRGPEEHHRLPERPRHVHPLVPEHVTELFVHPAHGRVPEVVLGVQLFQPRGLGSRDLPLLECESDSAAARGARHARHRVRRGIL